MILASNSMSEDTYYVAQCKHIYSAKTQRASENILRLVWQTSLSVRNTPSLSENTKLPMKVKCDFEQTNCSSKKRRRDETGDIMNLWYLIQTSLQ